MTSGDETVSADAQSRAALLAEAQEHVRPLKLAARPDGDGFVCDLLFSDGRVAVAEYGAGPSELLAFLVAEQRYLVEEEGRGSVPGATYLDKAHARVRQGPAPDS